MPFTSAEIRWFSTEKDFFWNTFLQLETYGVGSWEAERTDHYLYAPLTNTGVKVRQGKHEIKVKIAPDEIFTVNRNQLRIEYWTKWSTREADNLLNTLPKNMLNEWIAVDKRRWRKQYAINNGTVEHYNGFGPIHDGASVEFTKVYLPKLDKTYYTFALESFYHYNTNKDNLMKALSFFNIDYPMLQKYDCVSYPQFLANLFNESVDIIS